MAVIKCKMCGGDLLLTPGSTVAECEYCGSRQTVPTADNEKKLTLFARANRLRAACEFDKAAGVYEAIVADFPEEAEAYWGLVLCKYGIEYVDDPATGKKVPTCHRSSFDSVMDDSNFEQALENADAVARKVYREEAKQIEELRKGIIAVSSKEDPYDIFICYKETDENGNRTLDSVLAQDIYDALNEKGYRVFFSRISLEDKLGQEYEPYIFAALNSAKLMLVVGTDYEYFNAVWVKNEWSRFLHLITSGQKKTLIPCYKNIDAYDMPKEFAKLQAQDLGKVGAIQDLLRGIDKILHKPAVASTNMQNAAQEAVRTIEQEKLRKQVENAVSLGILALDARNTNKATQHFEEALKLDANCLGAYLGLFRAAKNRNEANIYFEKIEKQGMTAVREYLSNTPNMLGMPDNYSSMLLRATEYTRCLEFVEAVLKAGAKPTSGYTLVDAIAGWNSEKLVCLLLENGADANWSHTFRSKRELSHCWEKSCSLLYYAIRGKNTEIAKKLLEHGANPNAEVIEVYVQYNGEKSNDIYEKNKTVSQSMLNCAINANDLKMVKLLLDYGANPNNKRRKYTSRYKDTKSWQKYDAVKEENSELSDAIRKNSLNIVEELLIHGADPNYSDRRELYSFYRGRESLRGEVKAAGLSDAILYCGNQEIISMLLKNGAKPSLRYECSGNADDENNLRPYTTKVPVLALAIWAHNPDCINLLVRSGATFDELCEYTEGSSSDRFALRLYAFSEKEKAAVGTTIRSYGWKGSKDGFFSRAHSVNCIW